MILFIFNSITINYISLLVNIYKIKINIMEALLLISLLLNVLKNFS